VEYDLERAGRTLTPESLGSRPLNHWRYHELLPIEPEPDAFQWPVGFTPLMPAPRLAAWAGLSALRLKDDSRHPTGSLKDRASSVAVVHAMQAGATRIACASTGNAASSLAGYARGTYAQAYDLCHAACAANGWYNRNCAVNPYAIEGKKTCGLELAEQTAQRPADWVAVSVGDGCTIAGIGQGLDQMRALGFIEKRPRLLGVQTEGVHPIAAAFETGEPPSEVGGAGEASGGSTMADSINVPVPRNWRKAVNAVRDSGGAFVCVSDDEIAEAMKATGVLAGVFAEPAAAAPVAGVRRAVLEGLIQPADDVVAVITGSGLKDIRAAMRVAGEPIEVDPLAV
jgi:threonine synthase